MRGLAIHGKNKIKYEKTTKPNLLIFSLAEIVKLKIIENNPNQKTSGLPKA
jgi:hypothetical protein